MNSIIKPAAVLGLAGVLALAAMTPSEARSGRWAAAGVGFAVGALIGAAAASANAGYYYGQPGYYYGQPAYSYGQPAYSYGPGYPYYDSYAYQPTYVAPAYAPVYADPGYAYAPRYYFNNTRERQLQGRDW
jgi:hypothetical protein